jgi:TPR repeat protein/serine/threonine protein kinase
MTNWNEIDPQKFILNRNTHSGILLGTWGVKSVAVKFVHSGMENFTQIPYAEIRNRFQHEINILEKASSHHLTNVVEVYGIVDGPLPGQWFQTPARRNLLYPLGADFCAYGIILSGYDLSLQRYIHDVPHSDPLPARFSIRIGIINDIVKALCDLHRHGVIHGDLKSANVLLDKRTPPTVRVCDFGISSFIEDVASLATTFQTAVSFQGTYVYAAPEMLIPRVSDGKQTKASRSTDVYALGVLMWEILTGKLPFQGSESAVLSMLIAGERPNVKLLETLIPKEYLETITSLIERCWSSDRKSRPSAFDCFATTSKLLFQSQDESFDIFFSHAWKDNALLVHVFTLLSELGYRIWYDKEEMDYEIEPSMFKGIEKSSLFLCCLSSSYAMSKNCMKELRKAQELNKKIIVLIVENDWENTLLANHSSGSIVATDIRSICRLDSVQWISLHGIRVQFEWEQNDLYTEAIATVLWDGLKALFRLIRKAGVFPRIASPKCLNGYEDPVAVIQKYCVDGDHIAFSSYWQRLIETDLFSEDILEIVNSHVETVSLEFLKIFILSFVFLREKPQFFHLDVITSGLLVRCMRILFEKITAIEVLEWFDELKSNGTFQGFYLSGYCYSRGIGFEKDFAKSVENLQPAKEKQSIQAITELGSWFLDQLENTTRDREAVALFRLAMEAEEPVAMRQLGCCYESGRGVERNLAEAVRLYRLAVEKGSVDAISSLGFCYQFGLGVERNGNAALNYYNQATEKGSTEGMIHLATCYRFGLHVKKNEEEALKWYRLAAGRGSTKAMSAIQYLSGARVLEDETVVASSYSSEYPLIGIGIGSSMYLLGSYYERGSGVEMDQVEAVKWYKMAAEKDHPEGTCSLGYCYEHGIGVEKNLEESIKYYHLAIAKGDTLAMFFLGLCYERGIGVVMNMEEAVKWYKNAEEKGHDSVLLYNLGECYFHGKGVGKNIEEAVKMYKKAGEKGDLESIRRLARLYMNGREVEKNEEEAAYWTRKLSSNR